MAYLTIDCPICHGMTFATANEYAEHHLDEHSSLMRRDGTPLVPIESDGMIGASHGGAPRYWPDVRLITNATPMRLNGMTQKRES